MPLSFGMSGYAASTVLGLVCVVAPSTLQQTNPFWLVIRAFHLQPFAQARDSGAVDRSGVCADSNVASLLPRLPD